jgi:hypothetical protein
MKEIKPELSGISAGESMNLISMRQEARLTQKRIFCGFYKMFPLYVTPEGFILQLPDDEPEVLYTNQVI